MYFWTFFDALAVAQDEFDAQVGVRREVADGVLGGGATAVIRRLLPALLFPASSGAVLNRQTVVMATRHVVAERFPANGDLSRSDVQNLELSWAVHGL